MNGRERVLTALRCGIPDRVPQMHSFIDTEVQEQIVGRKLEKYVFDTTLDPGVIAEPGDEIRTSLNYCIHPDTADKLGLDAIGVKFNYPLFVKGKLQRGGYGVEDGLVKSMEDVKKIRMPDPDQEDVLQAAKEFIEAYGQKCAVYACIRMGISPVLMGMGYETFSMMLYDDREAIHEFLSLYLNFNKRFLDNLTEVGFDFLWSFDDIAFHTGPLFSPTVWDEVFVGPVSETTQSLRIPWVYHSDGNLLPILDRMLPLGMSGIHPLEPGTMDLDYLKNTYGKKVCLVGNIDINHTLSAGSEEEVRKEVRERIEQLGPGGGFIISDSNGLPYFCSAESIKAMSRAVTEYGEIYGSR